MLTFEFKEPIQVSRVLGLILALLLPGVVASCKRESGQTGNPQVIATGRKAKLSEPESALIIAAAQGDTKMVKDLLDKGVSVDTRDLDVGLTPLGHAAWFGHVETARLLIERGADVNAKKSDGTSVLMVATMRSHQDLVEILRKAGAK